MDLKIILSTERHRTHMSITMATVAVLVSTVRCVHMPWLHVLAHSVTRHFVSHVASVAVETMLSYHLKI